MKHGRRFWFAMIAIICVTNATILLEYTGETYIKLVATIVGVFIAGQTFTDYKGGSNGSK